MKRKKPFGTLMPLVLPAEIVALFAVIGLWWVSRPVFCAGAAALLIVLGITLWYGIRLRRVTRQYLLRVARCLDPTHREALEQHPLPVVVSKADGTIVWYNRLFHDNVIDGGEYIGQPLTEVTAGKTAEKLMTVDQLDIVRNDRQYTLLTQTTGEGDDRLLILYFDDNTHMKVLEEEYFLSRPVVLVIYIDNLEELLRQERESEHARVANRVEEVLEEWFTADHTGIFRKYTRGRFMLITEHRRLEQMMAKKFDVLDAVRKLDVDGHTGFTLSIGAGEGLHPSQAEANAWQALDMALGRGGDQAAVKHASGFDFYGGVSRGVEKRTQVRSRIIATALKKLLDQHQRVLVMGHRFSDLDCVGSALALTAVARHMGDEAFTVINQETSLAKELIERYKEADRADWFITPEQALSQIDDDTLLIVTDTHSPAMLECKELYERAKTVVVIDHHRKMVEHIDNAIIFYHETFASSASEMVTELIQTLGEQRITPMDAESLMAGMMLDTRNFVMKVGAGTFEAAATLRRLGAEPVSVKQLFAGSMEGYRIKAAMIASAELYGTAALTLYEGSGTEVRIAASQAADELLSIRNVDAAFALFIQNGGVNISARSLGYFNVQLVMEALGGGGHMTMAGAFLPDTTLPQAKERLTAAIDRQREAGATTPEPEE